MKSTMLIRTPADLGAVIRDRRKQLDFDQATLAKRIGVNRKWVIGIERGRARAELGLVLRALDALGVRIDAGIDSPKRRGSAVPSADIDAIVAAARKTKR
jgi:transcriptional regulator with XRE-family HTH domain